MLGGSWSRVCGPRGAGRCVARRRLRRAAPTRAWPDRASAPGCAWPARVPGTTSMRRLCETGTSMFMSARPPFRASRAPVSWQMHATACPRGKVREASTPPSLRQQQRTRCATPARPHRMLQQQVAATRVTAPRIPALRGAPIRHTITLPAKVCLLGCVGRWSHCAQDAGPGLRRMGCPDIRGRY